MGNGAAGLHIIGDAGLSNENIVAYVQRLNPSICVVVNNHKLAAMLLSIGVRVIYRLAPYDNFADSKYDAKTFVDVLHHQAPQGAILCLGNEPGRHNLFRLNRWTLEAQQYALSLGRKCAIFSLETGVPERNDWNTLRPSIEFAKQHGNILCLHEYFDRRIANSTTWYIGRFKFLYEVFHRSELPEICISEFGCAVNYDPYVGWRNAISPLEYAYETRVAVRDFYSPENITICVFSYGRWQLYGIDDSSEYCNALVDLNKEYVRRDVTEVYPHPSTLGAIKTGIISKTSSNYVNLRQQPSSSSRDIGDIYSQTQITYRENTYTNTRERYRWMYLESHNGWIASDLVTIISEAPRQEVPRFALDVPFVSQREGAATRYANDCGVACALMFIKRVFKSKELLEPSLLSVDLLASLTSLATRDDGLLTSEVKTLLSGLGVSTELRHGVTSEQLVDAIRDSRPVLPLVNYKHLNSQQKTDMGHFVVIYGYNDNGFFYHDPYVLGPSQFATTSQMMRALEDNSMFATYRAQALILER